jgi:hypothetical protein
MSRARENVEALRALDEHVQDDERHLTTSEREAIDNSPNEPTAINPFATQADIASSGGGDMMKSI